MQYHIAISGKTTRKDEITSFPKEEQEYFVKNIINTKNLKHFGKCPSLQNLSDKNLIELQTIGFTSFSTVTIENHTIMVIK